ncbi:hypothetical protein FQN52_004812 [Onygenales sp. PD_12]|nr:hypothetical protein FQN52_004812 [Onygenales sp. PD_12]
MHLFHGVPAWAAAVIWLLLLAPFITAQDLPNLRILPLGDSITKGSLSRDGNGYRKRLRDKLTAYGTGSDFGVDMVGSLRDGKMQDKDHEGHSGERLAQINDYRKLAIRARPNVVLVHAGTNDMDKGTDSQLDLAPSIMERIIDGLFEDAPDATVLVAPVIWANDPRMNKRTDAFNAKLETNVRARQKQGKHILTIPIAIGPDDLADRKHPNDAGYEKMAQAWFDGILDAHGRGWLKAPKKVDPEALPGMGLGTDYGGMPGGGSGDGGCKGGNWEKIGTIFNDFRVWEEVGTIRGPVKNGSRDKVILADLNGDGVADYVIADNDGTVRAWLNEGRPNQWKSLGKINPPWKEVTGDMVRLADVDDDGKADLIVLYSDGAAKVWKNTDDGSSFESLDSRWATGLDFSGKVYFQDMDGDGYADYVTVSAGGVVKWAKNTQNNGKDADERNWHEAETIAPGPAGVPPNRVRLYDLDGDKMGDYVIVYEGGAVKALMNSGNVNEDGGLRNWDDLGTIAPGISGVTGDMIEFADMDGDGLADFLAVAEDGSIKMWKNNGLVGSKLASIRFADLTGNGRADLISVNPQGVTRAWLNKGYKDKKVTWEDIGEIAPGIDENLATSTIEFADVNGDKRADFLVIYKGGAVKAYLNNGNFPDAGKDRNWQPSIVISPGVEEPGRKIRFSDLNGDGYADYLVVYDGGAVDAFLNRKNIPQDGDDGRIWEQRSTIATGSDGEPGSKVRFADITGDGRAEYIIQYDGGAAKAFNNTGNIPDQGRPRTWYSMGTIAGGVNPQGPVRYADINGDGKDDYLVVFGDGTINAYINTCDWKIEIPSGGGGGGDGGGNGGLSGDSTCDDFDEHASGDGTFKRSLWDAMGTSPYWKYWLAVDPDAGSNTIGAFARDWGISNVRCTITGDSCEAPACDEYKSEAGSGRAAAIMTSLVNLHSYFKELAAAIDATQTRFNSLQRVFYDYCPEPKQDNVLLQVLLNIGNAGINIFASMAGPAGAIGATVLTTVTSSVGAAILADKEEFTYEQDIARVGFGFVNSTASVIYTMHDQLLHTGSFQGEDQPKLVLDDILEEGQWLDASEIPIINTNQNKNVLSATSLGDWYFNFLHASVINHSWRNSMNFIVGQKMTKETFDSTSVDKNLKVYYEGLGYFFQSYERLKSIEWAFKFQKPPGFDQLQSEGLAANFDMSDIMLSSIDTFNEYGFNYTEDAWMDDELTNADWDSWIKLTPRIPGTFTLPLCIMDEDKSLGTDWKLPEPGRWQYYDQPYVTPLNLSPVQVSYDEIMTGGFNGDDDCVLTREME